MYQKMTVDLEEVTLLRRRSLSLSILHLGRYVDLSDLASNV